MKEMPYLKPESLREDEGQQVTLKLSTTIRELDGVMLVDLGDGNPPVKRPVKMVMPEELEGKLERVTDDYVVVRIGGRGGGSATEKIPIRAICGLRKMSQLAVAPSPIRGN